jgi:hypothetical protein
MNEDRIDHMHDDMHMLRQVRKALNDIEVSFKDGLSRRAEYQVYLLHTMVDEQPSRRKPWSTYQKLVIEECE